MMLIIHHNASVRKPHIAIVVISNYNIINRRLVIWQHGFYRIDILKLVVFKRGDPLLNLLHKAKPAHSMALAPEPLHRRHPRAKVDQLNEAEGQEPEQERQREYEEQRHEESD